MILHLETAERKCYEGLSYYQLVSHKKPPKRIRVINGIEVSKDEFLQLLKNRIASTDMKIVKQGVEPFIVHGGSLEIWSNDYFLQLAEMIQVED
jgi:hypothetical protein